MGYSGLSSWIDSDNAADFVAGMMNTIATKCSKHVSKKDNEYNTSGCVDVALFAEAFLMKVNIYEDDPLYTVLSKAKNLLEIELKRIQKQKDWGSKGEHVSAYKRMIKNLNTILTENS